MSELKLQGKIKVIGEEQKFDSGFRKLEFVITTNDQYPQDVKFDIVNDKIDDFKKYNQVGKDVEVSFNVRGNEYKEKYYVNLQAWKVWGIENKEPAPPAFKPEETTQEEETTDGLPF